MIHLLTCKGTDITFCWVPSHCNIFGNELADSSAKKGAQKENVSVNLNILMSLHEAFCALKREAWHRLEKK